VSDEYWKDVDKNKLDELTEMFRKYGFEVINWKAGANGFSILLIEIKDESK
jgi:hypothetical protein